MSEVSNSRLAAYQRHQAHTIQNAHATDPGKEAEGEEGRDKEKRRVGEYFPPPPSTITSTKQKNKNEKHSLHQSLGLVPQFTYYFASLVRDNCFHCVHCFRRGIYYHCLQCVR